MNMSGKHSLETLAIEQAKQVHFRDWRGAPYPAAGPGRPRGGRRELTMKVEARDIPQPVPEFTPFVLTLEVESQDELDQLFVLSCTRVIDRALRNDDIYRALIVGHTLPPGKRQAFADRLKAVIQEELQEEIKAHIRDMLNARPGGPHFVCASSESFYN